jgi:Aerotolerance regulator N-terminal/von Willebrand factor type A domain
MPFSFLHTAILFGLIALVIPPIVHLLNRRRFEVVNWAAMQFLKITKKIRRRVVFEHVLLMLLRCGLILVLVLAIASPVLDLSCVNRMPYGQSLAKMAGQTNRDVVIVIDGSYSMEYEWQNTTADRAAREWAKQFLNDLLPGDRVAVLQAKQRTIPVVEMLTADRNEVRSRIEAMPQPRGGVRWDFAVPKALDLLQFGQNPQKEIIILTDGQRQGWADADALGNWQNIAQLYAGVDPPRITVVNVVPDRPTDAANWYIVPKNSNRAIATIGRKLVCKFELKTEPADKWTEGAEARPIPAPPKKVTFEVDGKPVGSTTPVHSGTPAVTVDFEHRFNTPGTHLVSAIIDRDALAGDNRCDFAVEVLPSIPVLLVDGEPRDGVRKRSSDFLRTALAPANDTQPSFILRTVSISDFGSSLLTSPLTRDPGTLPRVLILCNVPELSSEQSKAIEDFLRRGGGVFVTLGERCKPRSYNALFPTDGRGWLPARLLHPQSGDVNDRAKAPTPHEADLKHHSALELFKDARKNGLTDVVFPRFWLLDAGDRDAGTVILKMKNRQESPLLVERSKIGIGRAILSAVPFDDSWQTELPRVEDFVPLCHELIYYLAAARSGLVNLEPNAHIVYRPADGEPPCGVTIETPDGLTQRREVANWPLDFEETRETGVYKLKTDSGKVNYYVVQPDSSESILVACEEKDRREVQSLFPEGRFLYENDRGKIKETFAKNSAAPQLWWLFLILVLGVLLAELAFARSLARKSPPVTD